LWLRWYDQQQHWIPTPLEQEKLRVDRLAAKLRELGVDPEEDNIY